jgi:outer membrane scaffolding protein for murein synthesis (MipA/OmpV family)
MIDLCCRRVLLVALIAMAIPAAASAQAPEQDQFYINVGGAYQAWFQNQQDFRLGAVPYDDRYVVQMLRLNTTIGHGDYVKVVTRLDAAKGWWGFNNASFRDDWNANPNPSNRWANKDTNYLLHFHVAYLEFGWPNAPVTARVGRQYYGLGQRLILDSNFDGVQVDLAAGPGKATLGWAKVSEGVPASGISDLHPTDAYPALPDGRDADLFMASYAGTTGGLGYSVYGMHYNDQNALPFFPNRIDYMVARFTPAISRLSALGATANFNVRPLRNMRVEAEANYLFGEDDLDRVHSLGNQLLDVNDGTLRGYNLYARATLPVTPQADLGFVFGRGSGDDDVTGGRGNVNKFKTMGYWYLTDVWEQSIMPDEEGITPQGLGAPNIRGYRELENTTVFQVNATVRPIPRWRANTAFTLLRATEPIRGWVAGPEGVVTPANFTDQTASDLGHEIDFLVGFRPYQRLDLVLRGGYLWAGDASQLLINGVIPPNPANPWQIKGIVQYSF